MKKFVRALAVLALLIGSLTAAGASASAVPDQDTRPITDQDAGLIVVANRGSGDLSVIDARSLDVKTIPLPDGSEPMYVNHWRRGGKVFVGDRANDRVLVLNDRTFRVEARIGVGAGVFHQWIQPWGNQLWVVGDVDNTVSVVNARRMRVVETIKIPQAIVDRGGKPHDVFVQGGRAFVSIIGFEGNTDLVLAYDTRSFDLVGRIRVGDDPHLFLKGNRLYVASQGNSTVQLFNARTLAPIRRTKVPSAHGIWVTPERVFVTNIAGGGKDAVWLLNRAITRKAPLASTKAPTPHNITVDRHVRRAFVTHSGADSDQVSAVSVHSGEVKMVSVGKNPFGLALVR